MICVCVCHFSRIQLNSRFSCVQLFVTIWTIAYQAPYPWASPGKNTGVGCHFLQGIFPTQGSNPGLLCLLHWQAGSYHQRHLGSLEMIFGAQENKLCHCFHFFHIYLPWGNGLDAMILVSWMFHFKPAFSLFSYPSSRGSLVQFLFDSCHYEDDTTTVFQVQEISTF